ncbi:MAG: hypothetical protein C5B44_04145 [Acidobacteria bacterium]|nr:MAG: hypothetical protein C5B44_04145 [Acidobacteriota bacterium]
MHKVKKVRLSAALVVLLCFFMPWIQVSCGSAKDSISGIDLARDNQSLLWLIPILIVATLVVGFFIRLRGNLDLGSLLGFASGLVSAYLMNRERIRAEDNSGLLQVSLTGWFWLGLGASIVLAVTSAIDFLKPPKPR